MKVYDLGQPYFAGMPHHPTHPPFLFGLVKQHGEYVGQGGASSSSDAIALGSHVGTHIDALCHFSCGGKLFGGVDVAAEQSYTGGLKKYSVDTIPPIVRRGVLLDVARVAAVEALPSDFTITPAHLDQALEQAGVTVEPGDVVLLRTGWAQYFEDAAKFISEVHGPGPGIDGARWLSGKRVFAVGSDTVAFEKVPALSIHSGVPAGMPVHVHLLVESGIHIIECLNLEELAAERVSEFHFIAAPMKIRGATGAPVRPIAIVGGLL